MAVRVRLAGPADGDFLAEMLIAAFFWRSDGPQGDVQSVLGRPEVAHYVRGWPRVGDLGVVAEDGPPVGAAWLCLPPEHDRGYGFVDTLYGQLLRRMTDTDPQTRYAVVVPTTALTAALRVPEHIRDVLGVEVFGVDDDGLVQQH